MRASRLLSLLLLLQARGRMTGAELARELEVSERTVARDVVALGAAGVPVYAERGRAGGYRLVEGFRTRLTGLTRQEAEALFLSGLTGPVRQMGLADAVLAARTKVSAALPGPARDAAQRASSRFHLDVPGWFDSPATPPVLPELARATWSDLVVTARYRRGSGPGGDGVVERVVHPHALVLKAGLWYLLGRVSGAFRTYRVDRFVSVRVGPETFERDEDFDPALFWSEHSQQFVRAMYRERITVRLSPQGVRALRFVLDPVAVRLAEESMGQPDEEGWVTTRLPIESPEVGFAVLLRFGPEVEVLDPPGLRARLAEAGARLAARNAGPGRAN